MVSHLQRVGFVCPSRSTGSRRCGSSSVPQSSPTPSWDSCPALRLIPIDDQAMSME